MEQRYIETTMNLLAQCVSPSIVTEVVLVIGQPDIEVEDQFCGSLIERISRPYWRKSDNRNGVCFFVGYGVTYWSLDLEETGLRKLDKKQLASLKKRVKKTYPDDAIERLTGDQALGIWWSSRSARLRAKMLEIDRDQMRSAAESLTRFVR